MQNDSFVLKGNICCSRGKDKLAAIPQGYLVCVDGVWEGAFEKLPEKYEGLLLKDYGDRLLIPGMTDLHVHAPQYAFRGLGMDLELLDWLDQNTFPQEGKYEDVQYAQKAYEIFAEDMKYSATARACVFGTIHSEATVILMDLMEASGLVTCVGKVNMDRNSPEYLCESSYQESLETTVSWLQASAGRYRHTKPILTPRFIPTCSDELMEGLKELQKKYDLPVQSHLSENFGEIAWVRELCPWSEFYGDAYRHFGLFGGDVRTIMAHCVHSAEEEIQLMKEQAVYVAHCPQSNTNLSSGIAPVRRYLEEGIPTGLGTDIAGGATNSMFRCISDAIQVSKLRWRLVDQGLNPLTLEEAFYLATVGGGSFFGKVGCFDAGYEADVLVLDDSRLRHPQPMDIRQRVERFIYLAGEGGEISAKYVAGEMVFDKTI